ncbi:hypothetical protein VZT92_022641 [Zoarces viviparus]|uniref:Uncharacterized protein n=1 Tax=Zoarces viviparus TaxID=48416 RepID=A0AAW1EBZ5_ZOAVI
MYCPVYAKLREYPDGTRVSTTHLTDGRFVVIGPRLLPILYRSPTPKVDNDATSITEVEHRDVVVQTETEGIIPNLMGMWGYDEDLGELREVIPEGLADYRESDEETLHSPAPILVSLSPNTILDQNVLALVKNMEDQLRDADDEDAFLGF